MFARFESRVDWQFVSLAAQSLIVAAVGVWGIMEFSQYSEKIHAEQQSPAPVEQAELNPWAGSSFPLRKFHPLTPLPSAIATIPSGVTDSITVWILLLPWAATSATGGMEP